MLSRSGRSLGYRSFNIKLGLPQNAVTTSNCARSAAFEPDGFHWGDATCGYTEAALEQAEITDSASCCARIVAAAHRLRAHQRLRAQGAADSMDEGLVSATEAGRIPPHWVRTTASLRRSRLRRPVAREAAIEGPERDGSFAPFASRPHRCRPLLRRSVHLFAWRALTPCRASTAPHSLCRRGSSDAGFRGRRGNRVRIPDRPGLSSNPTPPPLSTSPPSPRHDPPCSVPPRHPAFSPCGRSWSVCLQMPALSVSVRSRWRGSWCRRRSALRHGWVTTLRDAPSVTRLAVAVSPLAIGITSFPNCFDRFITLQLLFFRVVPRSPSRRCSSVGSPASVPTPAVLVVF